MTETSSESRRGRQRWESGSLNTAFKQELANLDVQGQLRAQTLISGKSIKNKLEVPP